MRALVCLMGVVPRSIRYTWPAFRENLVRVLEEACDHVHLYVYNLDTGDAPVDGVVLDQGDVRAVVPADVVEAQRQADVDKIVDAKCRPTCRFRSDYTDTHTRNAMRQLHTEYMVGTYVERVADQFDVVVVCTADARLARPPNMAHVREAAAGTRAFTSQVNNADGYTNGFYVGAPRALLPVLKRYLDFESSDFDYEYGVKRAFDMHGVEHGFTDMVFWKIRANGQVFWPREDTSFLEEAEGARVRALYEIDKKRVEAAAPLQLLEQDLAPPLRRCSLVFLVIGFLVLLLVMVLAFPYI